MPAPLFAEADEGALKAYLIARLESASEADPDVLGDYILALLRHDQPREQVMATCISQLADFMNSDPNKFVHELFDALNTKSYLQPPLVTRKRSFDTASTESPSQTLLPPNKTPRYNPQAPSQQQQRYLPLPPPPQQQQYAYNQHQWPSVPPSRALAPWPGQGPPPAGWNATALPSQLPMVPVQGWSATQQMGRGKTGRIKGTCYDYLEKGICLRGAAVDTPPACPYDHGIGIPAVISVAGDIEGNDPYDPLRPNNMVPASLPPPISTRQPQIQQPQISHTTPDSRFETHKGPSQDKSNTSIVVENIPYDKQDETTIREYFSQFGPLKDVVLDPVIKGKAILVYVEHDSAYKAWSDPHPVFNNRFVKIFWKKRSDPTNPPHITPIVHPSSHPSTYTSGVGKPSSGAQSEGNVVDAPKKRDPEQVEKDLEAARVTAAKAQKDHEEKVRKKAELEKKKEELEKQRIELLERQRVEKERLLERIKRAQVAKTDKGGEDSKENGNGADVESTAQINGERNGNDVVVDEPDERKLKLQKMLADLQSQAKALNIPPSEYTLPPLTNTRTKTSFHRGSSRGRPFRARGRAYHGTLSRSLDLRPKAVLIPGIMGGKEEGRIREFVMMNFGDAVVEEGTSEQGEGAMIIKFNERYEAEEFMGKLREMGVSNGQWYTHKPRPTMEKKSETGAAVTGAVDPLEQKEFGEEEDEEGEIGESEGRWKR